MREKIADIYEGLRQRKNEIDLTRADQILPGWRDYIGKTLYESRSSKHNPTDEMDEWTIDDVSVMAKDPNTVWETTGCFHFPDGKVTKKLVEEARDYVEKYENIPLDMFQILFHISRHDKWGKSMAGEPYEPGVGFKFRNMAFDPADHKEKIEADRKEYEEYYKPREGYVACERCGKQIPEDQAVKHKLIYQGTLYGKKAVLSRVATFCSGQCAMDEQMSLEG